MADGSMAMKEFSGRELGRRIFAGIRSYVARAVSDLNTRLLAQHAEAIDALRAELRAEIELAASRVPEPKPAIVDMDAIRAAAEDLLESRFAKWELEFDRRADAKFERAIDRMPVPKDGEDGEPGGSVEDFDIAIDGRMMTIAMKIGERIERRTVQLDFPIERGVYQAGKEYEKSDVVTFAGSQFIATRDTTKNEKPETSPAWRLIVKRGRDGKDMEPQQ